MKHSTTNISGALAAIFLAVTGSVSDVRAQAPANDNCANATVISGTSITVSGDNTNATVENFENSQNGYSTVWYAWTPTGDGDATIAVTNANGSNKFPHIVSAYLGSAIQSVNLINSANGGKSLQFNDALATLTFPVKSGLTYRICFGSFDNGTGGTVKGPFSFTLNQASTSSPWNYAPSMPSTNVPSNDDCANAVQMTGASLNVLGYNSSATVETGEGQAHPNGYYTVWYAWTAQQDGDVTLTMTNANYANHFPHRVTVYLGGGIQTINLINSALGGSGLQFNNALATVSFPAKTGLTYRICIGSFDNGTGNTITGPFSFTLSQATQAVAWSYGPSMPTSSVPSNDDCVNAVQMTGASLNVVGYNASATVETGEGQAHPNGYYTVWYAWTAQEDGDVTLTMTNANYANKFPHIVTVYLGGGIQMLNLINSANGGKALQFNDALATVTFPAKTGLTYRICIGSFDNGTGNTVTGPFSFTLQQMQQTVPWDYAPSMPTSSVPSNDDCVNAVGMTGTLLNVVGYNASATVETGEGQSIPNGYRTIWYRWTAQQDGDVFIQVTNANYANQFPHRVTTYLGANISALNLINSAEGGKGINFNGAPAALTFPAKNGLTYSIVLGSFDNGTGNTVAGPISFTLTQGSQLEPWDFGPSMPTTSVPNNDSFANPVLITGNLPINVVGYNANATIEVGEPTQDGSNSVWYAWTAPITGKVIIGVTDANGTYNFPHEIIAYQGTSVSALHLVAGAIGGTNVAPQNERAAFEMSVTAGSVYRLCFSSRNNGSGNTVSGPFSFAIVLPGGGKPFTSEAGVYQGIVGDSAGLLKITVSSNGKFTGQLTLNNKTTALHGTFNSSGSYFGSAGKPSFAVSLGIVRAGDTYAITGSAGGENIEIYKSAFSKSTTLAESGKYTILFAPSQSGTSVPQGVGYATLAISSSGNARLVGRLADNTSFSVSGPISSNPGAPDQFTIYDAGLYHSKGVLSGVITFNVTADSDCDATIAWTKPATSSHYYSSGFTTNLNVTGSTYAPQKHAMALAFASSSNNAEVTFADGDLTASLQEPVTYTPTNKVIPGGSTISKLKISVDVSAGLFSGSFLDPQSNKKTNFGGALYTKMPQAAGFFLGAVTNGFGQSGAVTLQP